MRQILISFIIATVIFAPALGDYEIIDGEYMRIRDGRLSYNSQRVRLWGVNLCAGPKRGGDDLRLSFDRMRDVGFNGVRVNLFGRIFASGDKDVSYKVPVTVIGSDTPMERTDLAISLARERGMFFWMQFDRGRARFKPADYDLLEDDGTREQWNQATRHAVDTLVYVYPRAKLVFMEFAKNLLDHVNPYTQRRWGDEETIALWEVFNENLFVRNFAFGDIWNKLPQFIRDDVQRRWNKWLIGQYGDDTRLMNAWGELPKGESLEKGNIRYAPLRSARKVDGAGYQPTYEYTVNGEELRYPYRRGEDVVRFAVFLFQDFHREFAQFVRQHGKGIAVVPICPTGNYERNFTQYYATMCGDFQAAGTYGFACRPWAINERSLYYPYVPRVNGHPMMGQPVDIMRPAGQPYLIYECNDYRPNPYRAEFPIRIATMLIHQNADGAFWFNWDSSGYIRSLQTDEEYTTTALPMPDANYPNAGLVLANDEIMLSAIKGAGAMFLRARLPQASQPLDATVGADLLFDLGKPVMGPMENQLRHHAWRSGLRLRYNPHAPSRIPETSSTGGKIQQGPYTLFDWGQKGRIVVDAPSVKAHSGFNSEVVTLGDVKFTGLNRDFTAIYVVAEDGMELAKSKSILITMSSDNTNTGFMLDPKAMKRKWAPGLAEAVIKTGKAPVITYRVGATITAPWLKGMTCARHDFTRKVYRTDKISGTSLEVGHDEPMFYLRLTRL